VSNPKRALIAGESPEWRDRVSAALAGIGVATEQFASGKKAVARLAGDVQLLVVASQTSDVGGVALCRRVRELPDTSGITLLVVSQLHDEMDRVLAFENGADDFVPDPFSPRELAARVRAILRRRQHRAQQRQPDEIESGALRLDLAGGLAELSGRRLHLTLRELQVLKHLVQAEGRVVRRGELLRELDGEPHANERLVDTHVKSIRSKLGEARDLIETVRGLGYRFDARRAGAREDR
jgi:two-component system, OmpR family, phosphate regulon response regulator PhoB